MPTTDVRMTGRRPNRSLNAPSKGAAKNCTPA